MSPTRVLCVGFSVTEMINSYVNRVSEICEAENLDLVFQKCGIGGIGFDTLVYIIDNIFDLYPEYDRVVFEISTGAGRLEFFEKRSGINDLQMFRCVQEIADSALRRGKSVGFINFPRLDVDCSFDILDLTILAVGQLRSVPVRSIFWQAADAGLELSSMFNDVVHVNAEGAEYYARSLISLIDDGLSKGKGAFGAKTSFSGSFAQEALLPVHVFARHGYTCDMVEVEPSQRLTWTADGQVRFEGVSFLSGPRTGKFLVFVDGEPVGEFQSYDQYCYYDRFNSRLFPPIVGRSIAVEILDEIPDIPLLKGEPSLEERLICFGHALYSID